MIQLIWFQIFEDTWLKFHPKIPWPWYSTVRKNSNYLINVMPISSVVKAAKSIFYITEPIIILYKPIKYWYDKKLSLMTRMCHFTYKYQTNQGER